MKNAWVEMLEDGARGVKQRVEQRVEEAKQRVEAVAQRLAERGAASSAARTAKEAEPRVAAGTQALEGTAPGTLAEPVELPVVARLIVEIRSDGSRTVARGAIEDVVTGERVALEANGGSPAQLAASLASSLLTTPFALGRAAGALVRRRLRRPGDGER